MDKEMKTSVVIVTYRRMKRLEEIIRAWAAQCSDVWLCDCSINGVPLDHSGINYVHFVPDPGNKVRHAVATLTSGDIVIKADDDIMPLPGLVDDFVYWNENLMDCITGIHGRIFAGPDYYLNTTLHLANKQDIPKWVDFLGIITCAPREFLAMDLNGCETPIEDIYWHNYSYPHIPKYVIPTKNYKHTIDANDTECLYTNKKARQTRQKYYKKIYLENYKS